MNAVVAGKAQNGMSGGYSVMAAQRRLYGGSEQMYFFAGAEGSMPGFDSMKKLIGVAVAMLATVSTAFAAGTNGVTAIVTVPIEATGPELPPPPSGYKWEKIPELSSEFDSKTFDPDKWIIGHPYWMGREPSHFDPKNVLLKDGHLVLRSTTTFSSISDIADPKKDVWIHSACLSSRYPIATYGFYEARLKASQLCMTSSFWLQGKYSEIDACEELGRSINHPEKDSQMLMNTHFFSQGWDRDVATPERYQMKAGSADEYHTYGAWWKDQDTVVFYMNGVQVAEAHTGGPFLEPMYMFLDTEAFTWEGLPTIDSLNDKALNAMQVDWVRAWRLVPAKHGK
jgi:hypothetical protein